MRKIWLDKARRFYMYKTGKYIREKLAEKPRDLVGYRVKEVKPGVKVLLALRRKQGPRGGRTVAVALLRTIRRGLQKLRERRGQAQRTK